MKMKELNNKETDELKNKETIENVEADEKNSIPFESSRDYGRLCFSELQDKWQLDESSVLHDPEHESVEINSNGFIFGTHEELGEVFKDNIKQRDSGDMVGLERHHLIHEALFTRLGIDASDMPCVALYSDDHMGLEGGEYDDYIGIHQIIGQRPSEFNSTDEIKAYYGGSYDNYSLSEFSNKVNLYIEEKRQQLDEAFTKQQEEIPQSETSSDTQTETADPPEENEQ